MKRTLIEVLIALVAAAWFYVSSCHPFERDVDMIRTRKFQNFATEISKSQKSMKDFVNAEIAACGPSRQLQFDEAHILRCADKAPEVKK